jgi:Domain of unknown function (DUF1998)
MTTRRRVARPQGQVRQGQLISTFGPGAMTDLPNSSVLISGLDFWLGDRDVINEPRLSAKVANLLGVPTIQLETPPSVGDVDDHRPSGVPAFLFPEWFVTQDPPGKTREEKRRSRYLVHSRSLERGNVFRHPETRDKLKVVPVRFVRACRRGHIGDIDWYAFLHGSDNTCRNQGRLLFLDERGTSGDLGEIWIRCSCGRAERSMAQVATQRAEGFGPCDGARPWLGPRMQERCEEMNRLLVRTASNAYFPQRLGVISLPDRRETIKDAVSAAWVFLEAAESEEDVKHERRKQKVREALEGISDAEVWQEVQARRNPPPPQDKSVKSVELETLLSTTQEIGEDRPDGLFYARILPKEKWDKPWMKGIQKVVLVQRLREVTALVGFTRFEAAAPDTEGELDIGVRRADLARDLRWVPAAENRGEGVFLQFDKAAIGVWSARTEVTERAVQLKRGFDAWKSEHSHSTRKFAGPAYIMLHSFAHLLITTIALECGYPASSIRERIYAIPDIGYGILLYTGSSDAEGTLGGLIEVGRRIADTVRNALELGVLCSNDPICAQHRPENLHERSFMLGAACHGCLLVAETSCEQQNDFLDRALVVRTVQGHGAEFFAEPTS